VDRDHDFTADIAGDVVAVDRSAFSAAHTARNRSFVCLATSVCPTRKNVSAQTSSTSLGRSTTHESSHCHERARQHRQRRERSAIQCFNLMCGFPKPRGYCEWARFSGSARVSRAGDGRPRHRELPLFAAKIAPSRQKQSLLWRDAATQHARRVATRNFRAKSPMNAKSL